LIPILAEYRQRREALVERSAAQRAALARAAEPFRSRLAALDRAASAVRGHPFLAAMAAGAVLLLGRRKLLRWALRALTAFSVVRRIRAL